MTKATQPTFSLEQLNTIVAQAVAEALASKAEKSKADTSGEMDRLAVRAFKRAGFDDAKPRENILTYQKWIERGFRVKEGERAVKVKNFRLFHALQVEPITKAEQTKLLAEREARKQGKTADRLPVVTPISAAPKANKGKSQPQPQA